MGRRGSGWVLAILAVSCMNNPAVADELAVRRVDNWPQWRGPLANGIAPHGDPPIQWDEQTNIRWKRPLPGLGSSTPIIWENRVFVLTAVETDRPAQNPPRADPRAKTIPPKNLHQFMVLCFDRQTGEERWRRVACEEAPHEGRHSTNTFASSSPVTDGQRLYVSFGSRGLYCYSLDGKLQWSRDLGDMRTRNGWGEAASPVVHDDSLIVNWDHEDQSFITVLDAETGEPRWRRNRDEVTSWNTPLVVPGADRTQVIVNGTTRVRSYDLASGDVIWECGGQSVNAIPSPIASERFVYCMSGYTKNFACAIPLDATGDLTGTGRVLWTHDRLTPYVPSPILLNGRIYFTRKNSAVLSCLDALTGQPVIDGRRLDGLRNIYASPASAAGRLYFVGRDGTTLVARHRNDFEVLSVNQLDHPIDASPAIVGNQLFLRASSYLYCIEND